MSVLVACSSGNHKFTIIGNINGMPEQTVVLEQLNANDVITIVDSERSKPDGHFELSGISPEPGLYRIHFRKNKFILVAVDNGNMKVTADWNAIDDYNVAGSESSEQLKNFVTSIREHLRDLNTMSVVLDTLKVKGNDSILTIAKKNFQDMGIQFTHFVEQFADTTHYEPNAVFAARMVNAATENAFLEQFTQSINHKYPGTKMSKDFAEYYMKVTSHLRTPTNTNPLSHGAKAPDVLLPDVNGKNVALSSLRGKYVLLDFWASWCKPCRGENPNIVAAYQKYKGKNFTILSVSLDNNKDAWQRAIQDDHLEWTQVCDLKGWSSIAAVTYNVQSIPTNFLIDPQGRIIANDLRGDVLDKVLKAQLDPNSK